MPMNPTYLKPAHHQLQVVGHRGARALAPENTLAALRKALAHTVDEIEIDVRVTKDGKVVLHHDRQLRDQTGTSYDIRTHTYDELLGHKPDLTTLQAAIELVGKGPKGPTTHNSATRPVPLYIEVKGGEDTRPIVKIVQAYLAKGWQSSDFLFGSKSQATLTELHRALPDITMIVIEPFSGIRATWRARRLQTRRISMRSWWLWSGFIRSMSRHGYQLYAYTLNDPVKAKRWAKHGLAGVITDRPDLFEELAQPLPPPA